MSPLGSGREFPYFLATQPQGTGPADYILLPDRREEWAAVKE